MTAGRVVVFGSLNADLVVTCARAPAAGETVAGTSFTTVPGGKGANQAVAAARAGARVAFVGCVGRDDAGRLLRQSLREAGVDESGVREVAAPTGTAMIVVERDGQNRIVVVAGANGELRAADAARLSVGKGDHVLLQLEVGFDVVAAVARDAAARGATVHLNAAPADARALELADAVDHLVVNETEAELLAAGRLRGSLDAAGGRGRALIRALLRPANGPRSDAGFRRVTLTLGAAGAIHHDGRRLLRAAAPRVTVVDTTAAGDAFAGAWVAAECADAAVEERLRRAVAAGSLSVTRAGAQPSLPAADAIARVAGTVAIVARGHSPD